MMCRKCLMTLFYYLLYLTVVSALPECSNIDWARAPVEALQTTYHHCFELITSDDSLVAELDSLRELQDDSLMRDVGVSEPPNPRLRHKHLNRPKRSAESFTPDPILLKCINHYCQDSLPMPSKLNISCYPAPMYTSPLPASFQNALFTHCASKYISLGVSHFSTSHPAANHVSDIISSASIGPMASNPLNLHGRYAKCNSNNPYHGSWLIDNCKVVAGSPVNTIYMTPSEFNNIQSSTVFTPTLSNKRCPELAPLRGADFEISTDNTFDVTAYMPTSMSQMNKTISRSCTYHLCDVCVIELPLKLSGYCSIQTYKGKTIDQVLCNNSSKPIGFIMNVAHNSPHFSTRMQTGRFVVTQLLYYILYLYGYSWLTKAKGNIENIGLIQPSECAQISISYPEDLHVHVTTKCGSSPILLNEQLSTHDYCHNYFTTYYFSFIFSSTCTYWVVLRIIFIVALVYIFNYIFALFYIKNIILVPLLSLGALTSYLIYIMMPSSWACNKCHTLWTPYHECKSYCMCGSTADIYHDCLYYPKQYKLEDGYTKPVVSKTEIFKTFFSKSNCMTHRAISIYYLFFIYILACFLLPIAHSHDCCGHEVNSAMKSEIEDGVCHLSHDYTSLVYETPVGSSRCKVANMPSGMTESTLIENSCSNIQHHCTPSQVILTLGFLKIDPITAVTQCLLLGDSPFFDANFVEHCKHTNSMLSLYRAVKTLPHPELIKHRIKSKISNMVPSQFKLMFDSLPQSRGRGLPSSMTHSDVDFSSDYLFFKSDSNSQGFSANVKLSTSPGSGVVLNAIVKDNHAAFRLKVFVDSVRTVHKLRYLYTSCPAKISSNVSWSCWDSSSACRANIENTFTPTCFHHDTPPARWSVLPQCTIFTNGHMCSSCTVRPALDKCLDVYAQEYSHTEVDVCLNAFSLHKCTTITSKDSINRQYISMHTYGVEDVDISDKVVLSSDGRCLHGLVNDLYESDDVFGTPQFDRNGTIISYKCDFQPSYEWNKNFEVDFEKCTDNTHYRASELLKCGHTIIDELQSVAYIESKTTLPVELSITLPPSTIQILDAPKDLRIKSCLCYGCISCSEGYVCNMSVSAQSKGAVELSIDSGISDPNQIYVLQGSIVSSFKVNTNSHSRNPAVRIIHSGIELTTATCKVTIVKSVGKVGDFHTSPLMQNSVPVNENILGWIGSHIGYMNPLNWNIGLSAWLVIWFRWMTLIAIIGLIIAGIYYWALLKFSSMEKKMI